jgi:hypothetical protein
MAQPTIPDDYPLYSLSFENENPRNKHVAGCFVDNKNNCSKTTQGIHLD